MKFPPLFAAASLAFLAGCNSLDNPFASLPATGRDARTYNPQTGRYEWPDDSQPRKPRKAAQVASALASTPAPPPKSDGRHYDPEKGRFVTEPPAAER